MASNLFNIGVTGLNAAQANLRTTSHNIANAGTPGFSRQQALLSTVDPTLTGDGFMGNGVQVDTVRRLYDAFLSGQVVASQTRSSELEAYLAQLSQIDNLLADPTSGLSPALTSFFDGVQDVATHPENVASRQALLSSANSLIARFQLLDGQLASLRRSVDDQIGISVDAINGYTNEIARLNQAVIVARGQSGNQPPNDLLDQRDQAILDLNKLIRTTVVAQDDGALNVFIGNGQPVVAGVQTFDLVALRDPQDASRFTVGYQTTGATIPLQESLLSGGSLGGLLAFRSQGLDQTQNQLGRVAVVFGDAFNQQHQLGQDLNGLLGGNFFNIGAPESISATSNTGTAVITAGYLNTGALTASDYRLQFDGANYLATRLSDGSQTSFAALPANIDGVTLTLSSGAPAVGDSFLIRPTRPGASGLSNAILSTSEIAAAAPIRTAAAIGNVGSASISAGTVNAPPPPNANLQQPVTITFTGAGTFDVVGTGTGNPSGVAYTSGTDITYNGFTVQISGTPVVGDVFTIGPNTAGVSDNRNALRLAQLQTGLLVANGSATLGSAYAAIVSDVGSRTRELEISSGAESALLQQHVQARESLSGVNLDEEAANLVRYQQAYQAAGKVVQIATELFDTILQLGR